MFSVFVKQLTSEINEADLKGDALVFSPHEDDETLSCGGTIIKKRAAGADVRVYFLTDGSRSHCGLISEGKLAYIRAKEAYAACRVLGLTPNNVAFLDYKDSELKKNFDLAVKDVLDVLQCKQPEQVFFPYRGEPIIWSTDHWATNRIVSEALKKWNKKVTTYEYPTWVWYDKPLIGRGGKQMLAAMKQRFQSRYCLMKDFNRRVYIKDIWDLKRQALSQYKSQMERFIADPRWKTLKEVGNGKFLERFFQENEFFSVKEQHSYRST